LLKASQVVLVVSLPQNEEHAADSLTIIYLQRTIIIALISSLILQECVALQILSSIPAYEIKTARPKNV